MSEQLEQLQQNDQLVVDLQPDQTSFAQEQEEASLAGIAPTFRPIDIVLNYGLVPADLERLASIDILTLEHIHHHPDKDILSAGFSEKKLQRLREAAEKEAPRNFTTASSTLDHRRNLIRITTGCAGLDTLLAGGFETGSITEIYGEFNTGKTQICHNLCVSVQLPRELGGGEARALYIDTEGTFRPERISQIAAAMGIDPNDCLNNIDVARALSSDHQVDLLKKAAAMMVESRYALLIVDSVTSLFRTDYTGRGSLADRQIQLGKFMRQLHVMSQTFQVAVVITNQVVSDIAQAAFTGGGADSKKPIGGNILAHASTTRLQFRKGKGGKKVCRVVDSPLVAEGEASFVISTEGIRDADDVGDF